jgi:ketosteroid isomerase-like protein
MWQRFAVTLYLVAATAGLPFAGALAQATGTGAEPKVRAEIEAVFTGWLEALNKADGKAAAAFFAPGAPAINLAGLVRGDSQDYVNRVEQQRQRNVKTVATIAQVELIGSDAAYALGPYTATLGPDNRRLGIPVMADRHSI